MNEIEKANKYIKTRRLGPFWAQDITDSRINVFSATKKISEVIAVEVTSNLLGKLPAQIKSITLVEEDGKVRLKNVENDVYADIGDYIVFIETNVYIYGKTKFEWEYRKQVKHVNYYTMINEKQKKKVGKILGDIDIFWKETGFCKSHENAFQIASFFADQVNKMLAGSLNCNYWSKRNKISNNKGE